MTNTTLATEGRQIAPQTLVERALATIPYLRDRATQVERERQVPAETITMFRDAQLYRVMLPVVFGGFEYDFTVAMDLIYEIGRGCGSSAWVFGLGAVGNWLMALYPFEAQREVWTNDPDAIVCGSYAPMCTVMPEPGGYRIPSGRWSFASGVDHASWSMIGVMFPPSEGKKAPEAGLLLVPSSDYTVDDDWHTYGLRGTGSKCLVLNDVFVPEHRKLTFAQAASGNAPGLSVHKNPLYRVPFASALPWGLASPALGIVQGGIDDVVSAIAGQVTRGAAGGAGNRMADFAAIQSRVAEAAACIDAARLLLHRDCREVMETLNKGDDLSIDLRIRSRRDQAFAIKLAVQAANALNESTGGRGLYLDNAVQRAWRDAHAVSKHITLNWDAVSTMVGQHYFGLEPKGAY